MESFLTHGVRTTTGFAKLIIDDRIQIRLPNSGRNLLVGVPQSCRTVGDLKERISRMYLIGASASRIKFVLDQFIIPDQEDAGIFRHLNHPIRVVPCLLEPNSPVATLSPIIGDRTPVVSSFAIQPWREPGRLSSTPTQNGIDELDISNGSDTAQESAFKKPTMPPLNSEKRLTSSAKRRNRLRRASELAALQNTTTTDAEITVTPETGSEQQLVITPISYKNAKEKSRPPRATTNPYLESMEKRDKVTAFTLPRTTGTKRNSAMPESYGSPPIKMERSSSASALNRRPDTPRVPKSLKNPAALKIFNKYDINGVDKDEEKMSGGSNGKAYLRGKGRQLVDNLQHMSYGNNIQDSNPSSTNYFADADTSDNSILEVELTVNRSDNDSFELLCSDPYSLDVGEAGAAGPLDPDFYSALPDLKFLDEVSVNSVIAFKLLEIGENYEPQTSEYKEALVLEKSGHELTLAYLKSNSVKTSGKFEIEGYESVDEENPIIFSKMIEPKLVRRRPPSTTECTLEN